jgi:hypothetical protein
MAATNRKKISLYNKLKSELSLIAKQTALVFVGLMLVLLLTGGNPSKFAIGLSFGLGVLFMVVSERLLTFRTTPVQPYAQKEPTDNTDPQSNLEEYLDPELLKDAMQEAAVILEPEKRQDMAKKAIEAVLGDRDSLGDAEQFYRDIDTYLTLIRESLNIFDCERLKRYPPDGDYHRREVHINALNFIQKDSDTYRQLSPAAAIELKKFITFLSEYLSGHLPKDEPPSEELDVEKRRETEQRN